MKLCILDNDDLDPAAVPIWGSYANMFERLLRDAGFQGDVEAFSARHAQYPGSFDAYDVVLLTGSRADAFSKEPWVVDLCSRVSALLKQKSVSLLASNSHCPVAAYAIGQQVLCLQPHPEFDPEYSKFLLEKRQAQYGEVVYQEALSGLHSGHDGARMAHLMLRFMEQA